MLAQRIQSVNRCFYEKTTLLLACESSITESTSYVANTPEQTGLTLVTTSVPYGTNAVSLGNRGYWSVPDALVFGTSDFTIEFWISVTGVTAQWPWVMSSASWSVANSLYIIRRGADTGWGGTSIIEFISGSGTTYATAISTTTQFLNAGWQFVRFTRELNIMRVYVNDILENTTVGGGIVNYNVQSNPQINTNYNYTAGSNAGYMKGIRITKGIARNWPTMYDFLSVQGKC